MTPKKNIIRKRTNTLPNGTPISAVSLEPGFTPRETAFILWYTHPGTEAFLNAGRAATRAGYKPKSAVIQGYLLKQKPRIAQAIDKALPPIEKDLFENIWQIYELSRMRLFFDVIDFYRPARRAIKIRGRETTIDTYEIVPLNELNYKQRLCVDGIEFKGPDNIPLYKLPDRNKEYKLFMKCCEILIPKDRKQNYKEIAAIVRACQTRISNNKTDIFD